MNWKRRVAKVLSAFFYGYSGGFTAVFGIGSMNDPVNLTPLNLIIWPSVAGLVLTFPQIGKVFAEIGNSK